MKGGFDIGVPEAGIEPEKGHVPSAPVNPRIGLKFAITSGIIAVLTGLVIAGRGTYLTGPQARLAEAIARRNGAGRF